MELLDNCHLKFIFRDKLRLSEACAENFVGH